MSGLHHFMRLDLCARHFVSRLPSIRTTSWRPEVRKISIRSGNTSTHMS